MGGVGIHFAAELWPGVPQWLSYWSALQKDEIREWVAKISNYLSIEVILNSGWLHAGLKWVHPWQGTSAGG